jgi:S-adenosylmethionine decarboxylase
MTENIGATTMVGGFVGQHVLAEFEGIDSAVLDDVEFLCGALNAALREAGATVCEVVSKRFVPHGVTVVALLAESHASLHTYPEFGSVFLDVFTCGDKADPEHAVRLLADAFGARCANLTTIQRGRSADTSRQSHGTDELGDRRLRHEQEAIR